MYFQKPFLINIKRRHGVAQNDNREKFVHDFVKAWTKVMNANRFDLKYNPVHKIRARSVKERARFFIFISIFLVNFTQLLAVEPQ